jgi:hypothetical protein
MTPEDAASVKVIALMLNLVVWAPLSALYASIKRRSPVAWGGMALLLGALTLILLVFFPKLCRHCKSRAATSESGGDVCEDCTAQELPTFTKECIVCAKHYEADLEACPECGNRSWSRASV